MRSDKIYQWMAYRVPNRLRYFVTIDAIAKATTGKYGNTNVSELNCMEVVKRLEEE